LLSGTLGLALTSLLLGLSRTFFQILVLVALSKFTFHVLEKYSVDYA
jgi:hypothetical protein